MCNSNIKALIQITPLSPNYTQLSSISLILNVS